VIALAAAGCVGPRHLTEPQMLRSSVGVERAEAATAIGERMDRSRVDDLLRLLEDDDPAVRLAADHSLKKISGKDFGFVPYDDEVKRRPAVAAWREWWAAESRRVPASPAKPSGGRAR
jgi:hypothetical protein